MEGQIGSSLLVRAATPEDFSIIDELSAGEIPYTAQEYYNKVGDTENKITTLVVIERPVGKNRQIQGWRYHQYLKNSKSLFLLAGANKQGFAVKTKFFDWVITVYPDMKNYYLYLPGTQNETKRRWIKQSNSYLSNSRYEELFEYNK